MSELRKTATLGGVALVLLGLVWATTPRLRTPAVFAERGELFFPDFRDPNAARSLEVIEFDPRTAAVRPFKVQNRNNRWTIPSQHDYPVDAGDRLAQMAAAIITLKKDDFVSDNASDYERCGVIDPLDAKVTGVSGRGARLIIRDAHDGLLADVIVGKPVEGHPGFRYLRQPTGRRVYTAKVGDLKISTAFGDWIERDLLQVDAVEIDAVNLRNYSLDRSTGRVNQGDTLLLQKSKDGLWTIEGLGAREEIDLEGLDRLIRNIVGLHISGVLPKPPGITASLSQEASAATIASAEKADLARKGFYLTSNGQLVSNRGEVVVRTDKGVFYTLRFGDIAPDADGPASEVPAVGGVEGAAAPVRENRYLFIMVNLDSSHAATPTLAAGGAEKAGLLRARFAPWYYVIAADSFASLRANRSDLVKPRSAARRPAAPPASR